MIVVAVMLVCAIVRHDAAQYLPENLESPNSSEQPSRARYLRTLRTLGALALKTLPLSPRTTLQSGLARANPRHVLPMTHADKQRSIGFRVPLEAIDDARQRHRHYE